MITVSDDGAIKTIIVKPNHSATWKTNLWVVLAISVPSLGAAIAFALLALGQYFLLRGRSFWDCLPPSITSTGSCSTDMSLLLMDQL